MKRGEGMRDPAFGRIFLAVAAFLLAAVRPCAADIVYLTDGSVVEGEVTEEGDRVKVRKTSGITVVYRKSQVRRIVRQASAAEEYRKRKDAVAEYDGEGLLGLAEWCVSKGLETEAEAAFRACLRVASPVYRKAKREFAAFLENTDRVKEALTLYQELGEECAIEAGAARAKLDLLRGAVYRKAQEHLAAEEYRQAVGALERAYRFTPPAKPSWLARRGSTDPGPGSVTEEEVLARLVEARRLLAESLTDMRVGFEACPACEGQGTVTCRTCGGDGKTVRTVMVMTPTGMDTQRKEMTCESCGGAGKVRCGACSGLTIEVRTLHPTVRGALRSLGDVAYRSAGARLAQALSRIARWAGKYPLAFEEGKPPYGKSGQIRAAIETVPATAADAAKLGAAWAGASGEARADFLASYGLEVAKRLSMLPRSAAAEDVLERATELGDAEEVRPALVSAFPAKFSGRAVRVLGVWKGLSADPVEPCRSLVRFEAEGPQTLEPFTWRPDARSVHAKLGEALGKKGFSSRAAVYPYAEVGPELEARKPGDRVELAGRFYYDERPSPRWGLEVWHAALRPDPAMEAAVRRLSRKVTFGFDETPLAAACEMLAELTGVKMAVDAPEGVGLAVSGRVKRVPLARALDGLLRPLGLEWYCAEDGVTVATETPPDARARTEAVRRLIRGGG